MPPGVGAAHHHHPAGYATTKTATARNVLSIGGRLMLVGLGGGTTPVSAVADAPPPVPFEAVVEMPFWGTRAELYEVLALGREGKIHSEVQTFPLEGAIEAYDRLRAGEIEGRAVNVP